MKTLIILLLVFGFMGFAYADEVNVQVIFTQDTERGVYRDALYYPIDKYFEVTKEDLEKVKNERVNNWLNLINNPPAPVAPTKEEMEKEQVQIDEKILELQARKATVGEQISAIH